MSRPILSRPRTRVYGCNYDKGESYYKPMVDHLDRKYSSRPLFSEPRTSLADEIAARRSDIGSRDLSGSRNNSFGRDLDLELDPRNRAPQSPLSPLNTDPLFPEDEETVYDSRGQRTRRRFSDEFANEVASSTQRFKAKLASIGLDEEVDAVMGKPRRLRQDQDILEGTQSTRKMMQNAKSAIEEADSTFKRRSKLFDEIDRIDETKPSFTRWSKLMNEDEDMVPVSAAATRAKQTKARLNDLESEMEEMAERQAKRERRAAALRALVNESSVASEDVQQQSILSKKVSVRRSRNLSGNRNDSFEDLDYYYDRGAQDELEDDFVTAHRRYKDRAAAAFEEDLAELRRKRRDMQDRIFDVIDLNAEIEKAKTTLEAADVAFQRHATKFDNRDERDDMSLAEKLDRSRKIANMDVNQEKSAARPFKWVKVPNVELEPQPSRGRQGRINSAIDAAEITDPLDVLTLQPLKRKFLKRKKSVSF